MDKTRSLCRELILATTMIGMLGTFAGCTRHYYRQSADRQEAEQPTLGIGFFLIVRDDYIFVKRCQDIQTHRSLSEQEVLEINYITKKRALRYIAGAEREWLYPENHLSSTRWNKFGNGYLLMPEPREVYMGGETYVGYKGGRSEAWNAYGERPWQPGFTNAAPPDEATALVDYVGQGLRQRGVHVEQGRFGAHMQVSLTNDGPFTIWLEL